MTHPAPPDGPEMHVPTITVNRVESPHESFTWLGECSCGWESVISLLTFDESVMRDMHFNLMRHALDELRASSAASLGREQALTAERDFAMRPDVTWEYMHYPSGFMWKVRWRSEFQHIEAEGVSKAEAVRKALQEMERRAASSPSPKTPQ